MNVLIQRRDAAEATLRAFEGKEFIWGQCDCARMVDFHIKALGGSTPIGKFGSWASETGALRALKRNGYQTLEGVVGEHRLEIPPAMVLVGDIVGLQAESARWTALTIYLGNGRVLGFRPRPDGKTVCGALDVKSRVATGPRPVRAWRAC